MGGLLRAVIVAIVLLAAPSSAWAQAAPVDSVAPPILVPPSDTIPPPGFTTSVRDAKAIAERVPQVREARRKRPGLQLSAVVWNLSRWEVNLQDDDRTYVEIDITADGRVTKVWTGLKAQSYLARGHIGGRFDRWWVWAPFALLFLVPFVDPRRPLRLLHLDLLVLLSLGISYWRFEQGGVETAIRLVYPALAYLLVRTLFAGLRPRRARGRLVPVLPTAALAVGLVALIGARVALDVANDKVVDVGYASVVGANRVAHKQQLYTDNEAHGDTYGPVNYIAYIPFELAFPWHGTWDSMPAARAAAIFFDLMTLLGLFLLGRRLRAGPEGRRLGLALAWAWAAFPLTLFGLMQNTNDGLIAMLLVFALLAFSSPAARGALLGAATAAKFFPGALLLLFARGRSSDGRRAWLACAAACVGVVVFAVLLYLPPGGLREVWNCTLGYQLQRPPDFSLWAIYDGIGWTQTALKVVAVAVMLAVAVLPGRRDLPQIAGLAAATTIALQLPTGHWFYFYVAWFVPFVLVALFAAHDDRAAAELRAEPQDAEDAASVTALAA